MEPGVPRRLITTSAAHEYTVPLCWAYGPWHPCLELHDGSQKPVTHKYASLLMGFVCLRPRNELNCFNEELAFNIYSLLN